MPRAGANIIDGDLCTRSYHWLTRAEFAPLVSAVTLALTTVMSNPLAFNILSSGVGYALLAPT